MKEFQSEKLMRFSLRTLMIIFFLVTVTFGWFGLRYTKWKQEQQLLADLNFAPYSVLSDDETFERYSLDRLSKIAEQYSAIAVRQPSDSVAARIAAGALVHLGCRFDMKSNDFIRDARAIKIAENFFDSKTEPLATVSMKILMRHHRLSDDVYASQSMCAVLDDGYDSDNPLDVYLLVTEIYSEFNYCGGESSIEENWPTPRHVWAWDFSEKPSHHTYKDKVDALRQVSPDAADAYAAMVEVFRKCDAKPSKAQRVTLAKHSDDMLSALKPATIFRFMLKNPEVFKSQPDLRYPRLSPPQTPHDGD